jgi:regulator of RNase E activity RraA
MTETPDIERPPRALIDGLGRVGSAVASGAMFRLGIRNPYICGPRPMTPGAAMAGPALTLQFMPKREDLYGDSEYSEPEKQLHRHVLYHTQPGDVVVVDARANMKSGVFGEMMLTFFKGRGGVGVVVDGCIRDFGSVKGLGLGLWLRGTTANFHTQTDLMPFGVNVPIACGDALVMPGDIVIADDDGAVVVPAAVAQAVLQDASKHAEWEEFSRLRLSQGGDLRRYYPLVDDARDEYEAWRKAQSR